MSYKVLQNEPDACAFRLDKIAIVATLSVALFSHMSGTLQATTLAAPPIDVNGSHVAIVGLERDNSVFVPVKGFFELGAKVTASGSTLVATRRGKQLARMSIGSRSAMVNGATQRLPVAPFVSGGTVMLPLRSLSEAAGASVTYVTGPRAVNVTGFARAGMAAAGAAADTATQGAAPVANDAANSAPVASAASVADTQTSNSGIPWWVWALLGLIILGLSLWALTRRKKEPVITTRSSVRGSESTIATTGRSSGELRGNEPIIINTRK